jgi:hypothetical protein
MNHPLDQIWDPRDQTQYHHPPHHISIFTIFLPVLVQACTSTESLQASSETSYVQILTSTFIKIISVDIQPEKKKN